MYIEQYFSTVALRRGCMVVWLVANLQCHLIFKDLPCYEMCSTLVLKSNAIHTDIRHVICDLPVIQMASF